MFSDPAVLLLVVQVIGVATVIFLVSRHWARRRERQSAWIAEQKQLQEFVDHVHPTLGPYRSRGDGTWSCLPADQQLGGAFVLCGDGAEPSDAQVQRWQEIRERLPELLAQIPPPPDDDGYGHAYVPFDPIEVRADHVEIARDLSFVVLVGLPAANHYRLSPTISVDAGWRASVEWSM
ncbi:MAG: hypothetical protein C0483_06070 [Pirellula sp.]|nr:hypothetical protein [Pirellula sp.]